MTSRRKAKKAQRSSVSAQSRAQDYRSAAGPDKGLLRFDRYLAPIGPIPQSRAGTIETMPADFDAWIRREKRRRFARRAGYTAASTGVVGLAALVTWAAHLAFTL